jgi:predicted HD phosphohydrolase
MGNKSETEGARVLERALAWRRPPGQASQLLKSDWRYVEASLLDDFSAGDWQLLDRQRGPYLADERARQALEMLAVQVDAPTFGYRINNYEHCLQSATMALADGRDEETVVASLFHDLGFITNNETHGAFAAALLRPYVSERNAWMLERHMYFQTLHCPSNAKLDPDLRERWRGHPDFEYTAEWVAKYDVTSIDPNYQNAPLEVFVPLVQRVFARPPKAPPLPP